MKLIEITVSPTGESNVETRGFNGTECVKASQFIESALGKQNGTRKTAEYYIVSVAEKRLKNLNGS